MAAFEISKCPPQGFALIRPDETHRFEAGNGVEDVDVLWCHKLCDNAKDCSAYGYYNRRGVQESSQHRNTRRCAFDSSDIY
eukprot:SAG31_NODE_313_length_17858_cov_34.811307_16_plen_81_part_00